MLGVLNCSNEYKQLTSRTHGNLRCLEKVKQSFLAVKLADKNLIRKH